MRLVAASCANIRDVNPQPVWHEIQLGQPDVLLLLGDTVYLSRDDHSDPSLLADELRALYRQQFDDPAFRSLLADLKARGGHLIAIYDDHDFIGNNRGGADAVADAALARAARAEFVRAFSPALLGTEVYGLYHLGAVDLLVLDTRFHRGRPELAQADPDAILGREQWAWFETAFRASGAPFVVVASGTTLHTFGEQSWEHYPAAFQRMVSLLRGRRGALVISGDVHRNAAYDESGVIEIVTSAVAQRGFTFGGLRRNYGVLTFGADRMRVDLRSLKVGNRFDFEIELARWTLP